MVARIRTSAHRHIYNTPLYLLGRYLRQPSHTIWRDHFVSPVRPYCRKNYRQKGLLRHDANRLGSGLSSRDHRLRTRTVPESTFSKHIRFSDKTPAPYRESTSGSCTPNCRTTDRSADLRTALHRSVSTVRYSRRTEHRNSHAIVYRTPIPYLREAQDRFSSLH